jgi:hypothetical protein
MKHLLSYQIYESSTSFKVPIENKQLESYIEELITHVTYPKLFKSHPGVYMMILDGGYTPEIMLQRITEDGDDSDLQGLSLPEYTNYFNSYQKSWSDQKWNFDRLVYYLWQGVWVGEDEELEEIRNYKVQDYMRRFQKPERIAELLKWSFDGSIEVAWIKIK